MNKVKEAQTLIDLIYSLEPLCYYFNMKPNEFWSCTYREINIFTQTNLCRMMDQFRQEVTLQEAATDKLIMADTLINKHPKIIPIRKTFENLFPENKQNMEQSPEEITRKMRQLMKIDRK